MLSNIREGVHMLKIVLTVSFLSSFLPFYTATCVDIGVILVKSGKEGVKVICRLFI